MKKTKAKTEAVAAVVPLDVADAITRYAEAHRLSKSHVVREIVIGELSISQIKEKLGDG